MESSDLLIIHSKPRTIPNAKIIFIKLTPPNCRVKYYYFCLSKGNNHERIGMSFIGNTLFETLLKMRNEVRHARRYDRFLDGYDRSGAIHNPL